MKPLGKVKIEWSPNFAYALGLLATDGCLYGGRHINLTSKDKSQILNFKKCLGVNNIIGRKSNGSTKDGSKKYFNLQFGDILFYQFLIDIGITPAKTKTISVVAIPDEYFFDFLRGHFDGDGTFYSYWDPRWKSSFMFYMVFISASKNHIDWLQKKIYGFLEIKGHITKGITSSVYQLKYAKVESLKLFPKLYYSKDVVCLRRKRKKIEKAFKIDTKYVN